jgi:hypothetical protein
MNGYGREYSEARADGSEQQWESALETVKIR